MNRRKQKMRGRPSRTDGGVDLVAVGNRIRDLRGGATQEEFSDRMGISQAQLSKYELGQSAPPLGFLIKLSRASGTTVDWILIGKK